MKSLSCLTLAAAFTFTALCEAADDTAVHGIPYKPDPPPAIDGRLDEWEGVPNVCTAATKEHCVYGPQRWASAKDLSARVWLAWREEYLYLAADVTDSRALADAAARFMAEAGAPDVVVANAGISAGTLTGEPADAEVFRRIVQTNLIALPDTFAPFIAPMRARGSGALVGIASVAGIRGLPGASAYSASKAAAISYMESLRVELRGSGLRAITIAPDYIRTPMTAGNRYPMPFLTDADVFARKAVRAIEAGRGFVVIPWQMRIVAGLLRGLPNPVFDRLFARAPRKARVGAAD